MNKLAKVSIAVGICATLVVPALAAQASGTTPIAPAPVVAPVVAPVMPTTVAPAAAPKKTVRAKRAPAVKKAASSRAKGTTARAKKSTRAVKSGIKKRVRRVKAAL